jgi:hypothetical protein
MVPRTLAVDSDMAASSEWCHTRFSIVDSALHASSGKSAAHASKWMVPRPLVVESTSHVESAAQARELHGRTFVDSARCCTATCNALVQLNAPCHAREKYRRRDRCDLAFASSLNSEYLTSSLGNSSRAYFVSPSVCIPQHFFKHLASQKAA